MGHGLKQMYGRVDESERTVMTPGRENDNV